MLQSRSFPSKLSKQIFCLPFIFSYVLGVLPNTANAFFSVEDLQEKFMYSDILSYALSALPICF